MAKERIDILFRQALTIYKQHPQLADRYVEHARRLSMRYKVRIPRRWRLLVCRKCKGLMVPGFTSYARIRQHREPHLAITCLKCGWVKRIPIKKGGQAKP
ncbi:TPA: ribonuclease P [Candidatus Bathyarchaeota archaeon]|nr:ribonuclease P [Candidatus Bathyarchaeota archaeon]